MPGRYIPTPLKPVPRAMVQRRAAAVIRAIHAEVQSAAATAAEAAEAVAKVREVAARLSDPAEQRREIRTRLRDAEPVHELDCDVNSAALRRYVVAHGTERIGGTRRTVAMAVELLLRGATRVREGVARVRLRYHHSHLGRDLYEAGHISGSRVYARGQDPFKWPREMRAAAFHQMGAEYDDAGAYPRARAAMVPIGRDSTLAFLENRERLLAAFGEHLFREESVKERRARMKFVMNAWDMDAGERIWVKEYGNPHNRTLNGVTVGLPGNKHFSMQAYRAETAGATRWIAAHAPSAIDFLTQPRPMRVRRTRRTRRKDPALQLKSYLLQEAEATAREAKVAWFEANDVRVMGMQHDGVLVEEEPWDDACVQMGFDMGTQALVSAAASEACGFEVAVVGEECRLLPRFGCCGTGRGGCCALARPVCDG